MLLTLISFTKTLEVRITSGQKENTKQSQESQKSYA
jgi:hypothetical protein